MKRGAHIFQKKGNQEEVGEDSGGITPEVTRHEQQRKSGQKE